ISMDLDCLNPRIPDKIRARHCERQAVVYVRQSTMRQVEQNRESTRLQYGLADRACRLGWRREQILVIDDDHGRSAASALNRPGFQRLVAEVGLGHVGLVLGIEVSRLARSCRDWHQLLEMCALFDTLIGDADGIYDPSTYNDRLLLGLKGTMSEAELHILKARMHEGRRAKAARGELVLGGTVQNLGGCYVQGWGLQAGDAMRWRMVLELVGPDGTPQWHEIGAGERPPGGHSAA